MPEIIFDTDDFHHAGVTEIKPDGQVLIMCVLKGIGECYLSPGKVDPSGSGEIIITTDISDCLSCPKAHVFTAKRNGWV